MFHSFLRLFKTLELINASSIGGLHVANADFFNERVVICSNILRSLYDGKICGEFFGIFNTCTIVDIWATQKNVYERPVNSLHRFTVKLMAVVKRLKKKKAYVSVWV